MDTGDGYFETDETKILEAIHTGARGLQHIFRIGETIMIKESLFKVIKITPKKLTLRLLPNTEFNRSE